MSLFSSSILLVKKKDESWKFYINYQALKKEFVLENFLIPVIDELLDKFIGACVFSTLNLKFGYHQILMRSEDVLNIAFRTNKGHYEFLVMPFCLTNVLATFQSLKNKIFWPS